LVKGYRAFGAIPVTAASLEYVNQPLLLAGQQANLLFQLQLLLHIPGQIIISCVGGFAR